VDDLSPGAYGDRRQVLALKSSCRCESIGKTENPLGHEINAATDEKMLSFLAGVYPATNPDKLSEGICVPRHLPGLQPVAPTLAPCACPVEEEGLPPGIENLQKFSRISP